MRVVREQGAAGGGAARRHHPVVRALRLVAGDRVEDRAVQRAGGDRWRVGRQRRHQGADRVVAGALADPRAEQLLVPVAREPPCEVGEGRGPARLVVGELGPQVEEHVLDRGRRHLRDPRRDALAEPRRASRGPLVPPGGDRARRRGGARSCARTGPRRACARRTPRYRRPVAARSSRSSWKSRSPAVTNPCANHRSSRLSASMYGTPHASRRDRHRRREARERRARRRWGTGRRSPSHAARR